MGTGLAGLVGAVTAAVSARQAAAQSAPAPLIQTGGICDGSVIMLRPADAEAFIDRMLASSRQFQVLKRFFEVRGLEFPRGRAKVFLYAGASDEKAGPGPNAVGILASHAPINPGAASHEAVGISVHQAGTAVAGAVTVRHNPFRIEEFRFHEAVPDATGGSFSISTHRLSTAELDRLSPQAAAEQMGAPAENGRTWDPAGATLADGDREAAAALTFQLLMSDGLERPNYPMEGFDALMAQTPSVAKFAQVNSIRFAAATAKAGWCTSSSSSCNASSSTSTSTSISISAAARADAAR